MERELFAIRDRLTKQYELAFNTVNHAEAERSFNAYCNGHPVVAKDLELWWIGTFNTETGKVVGDPEFCCAFAAEVDHE